MPLYSTTDNDPDSASIGLIFSPRIPVLEGIENYMTWSQHMSALLRIKRDVHSMVVDNCLSEPLPASATAEQRLRFLSRDQDANNVARVHLLEGLNKNLQNAVVSMPRANEIWTFLRRSYGQSTTGTKANLTRRIASLHQGSKSLEDYISEFTTTHLHMHAVGLPTKGKRQGKPSSVQKNKYPVFPLQEDGTYC